MDISRIDNSIIPTSSQHLMLTNVSHVPSTHKNPIPVHCYTLDNDTFIAFYPYFFFYQGLKNEEGVVAWSM
jgi:hypothetical protein